MIAIRELAEIPVSSGGEASVYFRQGRPLGSSPVLAEHAALIAAADVTGDFGVGVLLESVLADKLAFLEPDRRLIGHIIEGKIQERLAA